MLVLRKISNSTIKRSRGVYRLYEGLDSSNTRSSVTGGVLDHGTFHSKETS